MKDTNPDMYPNTRYALGPWSTCPAATQAPRPMGSMRDCLGDNQHHLSAGDPNKNGQGKEMEIIRFQRTPVSSSGTPENDVRMGLKQHGDWILPKRQTNNLALYWSKSFGGVLQDRNSCRSSGSPNPCAASAPNNFHIYSCVGKTVENCLFLFWPCHHIWNRNRLHAILMQSWLYSVFGDDDPNVPRNIPP